MSQAACLQIDAKPVAGGSRLPLILDAAERLFVLGLYGWMVGRMAPNVLAGGKVGDLLLLMGEGLVVFFFLIRHRTTQISRSASEWMLAVAGTCGPLLVGPGGLQMCSPGVGVLIMVVGIAVQLSAKLTLARSFGMVPANRGVKTSGPYQVVRHPMYAGYLLMQIGFLVLNLNWWNIATYSVCNIAQVLRMLAEERFLERDPKYCDYKSRVAFRILPGVF